MTARREQLAGRITDIDRQLTAADGRRPQPLPTATGNQGSLLRSAGIGAAAIGAASLVPALNAIPVGARLVGGAVDCAALGSAIHAVSVSSRD